jgi:hypothetical protein
MHCPKSVLRPSALRSFGGLHRVRVDLWITFTGGSVGSDISSARGDRCVESRVLNLIIGLPSHSMLYAMPPKYSRAARHRR